MRQKTFAECGFEQYRKPTRRELFLAEMNEIIPWLELSEVVEPFYPKPEDAGRPPVGIERMLRIHFLQHWFNLSDPAVDEALYDSHAMRNSLLKGRDGFELMLASILPSDMPKAFIEGFDLIKSEAAKAHPPRPKAIFSSGAWYYDEPFKQWAAEAAESGTALLGIQHGGNYGSLAFHPCEDHEVAVTDRYFTWGLERNEPAGKTFPRPATKLSGRRPFGADNSKEGILFGATALPRYLFQFPSHPGRFADYLSWQAMFASALPQGLKSKMRARLHKADYGWSIAKRWKAICPEAMIESWERPFMESLEACRLYICDHLSTTFIEALSADKPAILFWDPCANELRPEARPYYERLFEAGILHY